MSVQTQVRNLLFERAGTFMLRRRLSSGAITTDNTEIYVANKPSVVEIGFSVSKETAPIESGNSAYPADIRLIKTGSKIAIVFNAFDRQLFRFGAGMSYTETTENAFISIVGEEHIVDASAGTVVMENSVKDGGLMIVKDYSTGMPYAKASGAIPDGNEFAFASATNTFTFNAADKGRKVIISYDALATATSEDYLPKVPVDYTYEMTITGDVGALAGASIEQLTSFIFDSVKFSGEITPPKAKKQSENWTINLEVAEAFGNKPLSIKYANKSDITKFTT
jgi:hypothetical protein